MAAAALHEIVLASNNAGKLRELGALLLPMGIALVAQGALGVPEAKEPYLTFIENALAKARWASAHARRPALADDSGLCVDALSGAPGVHSARFAGEPRSDTRNNQKLLEVLAGETVRSAYFYCALVLVRHPEDPTPLIAEGRWRGVIALEAKGSAGFGYDPLFHLDTLGKSAGELTAEEKNHMSHRGQAIRSLAHALKS